MVRLEILSADVTALLDELRRRSIPLYDIGRGDYEVSFRLNSEDVPTVKAVTDRRGDRIKVMREGIVKSWFQSLARHPLMIFGIMGIVVLTLWIPTRIFFVQVEGNNRIPAALILEESQACGIAFGTARSEIRNEEVKNYLLDQIPGLQWVGVNTKGCVARITVRERKDGSSDNHGAPGHMIARCDAVIRSCTVSRGTPMCKVGQAVQAGEILISGYIDCDGAILHTQAEGEIYGETERHIVAVAPDYWIRRGETTVKGTEISLRFGKKQINFSQGSGILGGSCVKMEREYKLTLPGGFALPMALVISQWHACDEEQVSVDAQDLLVTAAEEYLPSIMIAGSILQKQISIDGNTLYGNYACLEFIGQLQYEENTIAYGKSDGANSQR